MLTPQGKSKQTEPTHFNNPLRLHSGFGDFGLGIFASLDFRH